mgnify:FL=1
MKNLFLILAASGFMLTACGETKSNTGSSAELPLECNEVIEKQVQLFKEQNRTDAEIEAARKDFESGFKKLDAAQAAEKSKKQLRSSITS